MITPEPSVAPTARVASNVSGVSSASGPDEDARRAAEQDGPDRPAAGHAAGELDEVAQRRPELDLVRARARDVAGQAEELRPGREPPAPIAAYASPPSSSTMSGTLASVSTLLTTVGLPNSPTSTGNGGLLRGSPRLPSIDSKSAVSSPQM